MHVAFLSRQWQAQFTRKLLPTYFAFFLKGEQSICIVFVTKKYTAGFDSVICSAASQNEMLYKNRHFIKMTRMSTFHPNWCLI